ncbi:hypothetical protein BA190_08685 [Labrys sp. WJW]|uniref:hypothetical protein n=1 Tax=Labrys sp. WJW TaxID=1737983 RepID=UPI000831D874|nr:hypothetical protein [Labrys sp. WJW]OCC05479.1 hypothetical protein BA190_08685 [Labrys sp. WJW]
MNILAAILICASSIPIQDCDRSNALSVTFGPNHYNKIDLCQIEAMAYIANTGLVQKGDVVKVYCGRREQIYAHFSKEGRRG